MRKQIINLKSSPKAEEYYEEQGKRFGVTAFEQSQTIFNIYVDDIITSVDDFRDALTVFQVAKEDDVVFINLNSGGGDLFAVDTFLAEMAACEGKVVVKASGLVASAATLILLAADEFAISPYASLLFHSDSFYAGGKSEDVVSQATFFQAQSRQMIEDYYEGFFTPNEINDLFKNKRERWMNAEEFVQRWQNRQSYLEDQETSGCECGACAVDKLLDEASEESNELDNLPEIFNLDGSEDKYL